jgi:hypothetical protein
MANRIRFDGYVKNMGEDDAGMTLVGLTTHRTSSQSGTVVRCETRALQDNGVKVGSCIMGLTQPPDLHYEDSEHVEATYFCLSLSLLSEEEATERGLMK